MYRLLFRPHASAHEECGTGTPIDQCWLEPRKGTRGDFRCGVLPQGCTGPVTRTLIYSVGNTFASSDVQVYLTPDGQAAYRSLS